MKQFTTILILSLSCLYALAQDNNNQFREGGEQEKSKSTDVLLSWSNGDDITNEQNRSILNSDEAPEYLYFTTHVASHMLDRSDYRFIIDENTLYGGITMNDITVFIHAQQSTNGFDDYSGQYFDYIQFSGSNYDWNLGDINFNEEDWNNNPIPSEPYLTLRVRIPDSYPECTFHTQFKFNVEKNAQFTGWYSTESNFIRSVFSAESMTEGILNGLANKEGSFVIGDDFDDRSFEWDEPIILDLSPSICETKYGIEIVEVDSEGDPLLEYGTQNYKNASYLLTVGQAPSYIDLRNWTGSGSEPVVQNGEDTRYYRIMVITNPSWDPIWFYFRIERVDCDYHYLTGPDHVYDGFTTNAEEAAHNEFRPSYMTDPDNWLPASWTITKINNTQIPSQAQIYFTYGGIARFTFGPNDVGSIFRVRLSTNCPYNPNDYFTLERQFIVEALGGRPGLTTNTSTNSLDADTELTRGQLGDHTSKVTISDMPNGANLVSKYSSQNQVLLIPNPISKSDLNNLSVSFETIYEGGVRVNILSSSGQLISSEFYNSLSSRETLSRTPSLEPGFYVIQVIDNLNNNVVDSKKLVVTN